MSEKKNKSVIYIGKQKFVRELGTYNEEMLKAQEQYISGSDAAGMTLGFAEQLAETEDQRRFAEACLGALHIFASADEADGAWEEERIKLTKLSRELSQR